MRRAAAAAVGVIACMAATAAKADESVVIPTRPGITVALSIVPASGTPRAIAVLFKGGTGVLAKSGDTNFLLRIRNALAERGLLVAAVNVPSDKGGGIDPSFRASEAAGQDIAAVVAEMKRRADLPVWLIGTSNGSISAANGAARIGPPQIAGAVLTSSVWSGGMSNVPLEKIAVPVLIVHNRNDACPSAHFPGAEQGLARLAAAPAKELVPVASTAASSPPCEPLAPHGYYGIEAQVVTIMADWILAHSPPVNK